MVNDNNITAQKLPMINPPTEIQQTTQKPVKVQSAVQKSNSFRTDFM